ncbi:proteasome regulatory particle lid subunit RPN9 [Aspergillus brunneoviolaceus CBS 621.78]|uniref:Proteasome regulatory particle subunit n=2 Tax=Aspergillus TaxID=5052 RepID=A0A8G1RGB6_9EURO|nr:proteasome regulatory particle subunit [Aspergillus brunneoviolaceus CBS 621.78]XP_040795859.1 proteasome regulatory particle subunit [Aspergillus fijiensis CBS 313.89]RAH46108.1 proteasome regulatory particle subunit [Aspergillus brunneoviolaceus CBS 621.78]RAK71847.1 proteasome regulatory particle subunit [Aspergillus fijiensis CBS 313.89]
MENQRITDFLADQLQQAPEQSQALFLTFEDYWERKLWHQLTDSLIEFFQLPESGPQRLPIFKNFVLSFADRINQLKFVSLGLMASTECADDKERLSFLTSLADKVNKPDSQDAYIYALADVANVKQRLQDLDGAQKDLEVCQKVLDTFDSVETVVHASFYKVNADYYHAKQEFASFYKNALLYLACINLEDLSDAERVSRAYNLSVAALVSETIYNFGELLLHPILDSLSATPHGWLRDLLFAFNRGDLTAYDVLAGNVAKNQLLEQHRLFLYQKISLSALTEMVFRRPPHDRNLTFAAISAETKVKPQEIEHLIMKALSLGLLRGAIDQVAQVAQIHWVQPKVLDMKQIEGMRNRLKDWDAGVNQLGHWIEGVGKDVWAA